MMLDFYRQYAHGDKHRLVTKTAFCPLCCAEY